MNPPDPDLRRHEEMLQEIRQLSKLQNPTIRAARLSPRIPYNKAIRDITKEMKIGRARKKFEGFLEHLDAFGDPTIPLKLTKKGARLCFTLLWCDEGIPEAWIERLTEYFEKYWGLRKSELQRKKGERTAFKKKK